ncbi:MAG: 50S ribosomal protein L29 [Planctomycetes bacterium]|nr:50S ribosomal protein L29 [Planctomycetota bacterium]
MTKAMTEIRGLDSPELETRLQELRKEQFQLRFRGADETAAMNNRNRDIRRTIARILTVIGERERAAQHAGGESK